MESIRGPGLGKAAALLAKARDLGLIDVATSPTAWEEVVRLLRRVSETFAEVQVERVEIGEIGGETA